MSSTQSGANQGATSSWQVTATNRALEAPPRTALAKVAEATRADRRSMTLENSSNATIGRTTPRCGAISASASARASSARNRSPFDRA